MSSTISDGNENNEEANDGNRNKQENDKREEENAEVDVATFRSVIVELKELYNEFLIQIKLMQKDLSRAAKCDELESKVCINIHQHVCLCVRMTISFHVFAAD